MLSFNEFLDEAGNLANKINQTHFSSPIEEQSRLFADFVSNSPIANPAKWAYDKLKQIIKDFEPTLNDEQEIGLKIISLGNIGIYHVLEIDYKSPYILIFHCLDTEGKKAILIQHFSQLNFLLTVLPKLAHDKPARRIGFVSS